MRVAIYGGSFNPPHVGHAMVASWLRWTGRVDAVWLLPSFSHPFAKDLLPFEERVAMCEAVAGDIGVEVCTLESSLEVPSYTIDVLRALTQLHPQHDFHWVAGSDVLDELPRWKAWDEIARDYAPILVGRQGYPCPDGAIAFPEVSSTDIRARLARGAPADHLVLRSVRPFLERYRSGPKPTKP